MKNVLRTTPTPDASAKNAGNPYRHKRGMQIGIMALNYMALAIMACADFTNSATPPNNGQDLSTAREALAGSNASNPANTGTLAPSTEFTLPEGYDTTPITGSILSEVAASRKIAETQLRILMMILGVACFWCGISKVHL